MKSIACILILLVVGISSAFGALAFGSARDPRYPGKCAIRDNMILSPGEVVADPEQCRRVSCGDNGMFEIATCGVVAAHGGCELGDYIDKTLPYPKCCERHVICN